MYGEYGSLSISSSCIKLSRPSQYSFIVFSPFVRTLITFLKLNKVYFYYLFSAMVLFDEILKEIGEFGAYQKRVYLLAAAPAILVAFETLSVIFIFFIPDHR